MRFHTYSSPHLTGPNEVGLLMHRVAWALAPGALAAIWFFGWGVLLNLALSLATCLGAEALMLRLRGRPVGPALRDGSAGLTGLLLGLALPPLAPWWVVLVGGLFAMVLGKHLFGGLGYNPFNPAMVGYVVLLISFPREMTLWPPPQGVAGLHPGLLDALAWKFLGQLPVGQGLDSLTMASPLDAVRTHIGLGQRLEEIRHLPVFGSLAGRGWEWVNLGYLAGGLWLLRARLIHWRIPTAVLGSLFVLAMVFHLYDPDNYASPLFHLLSGATMLGAFFIATDPVTASSTPRGQLIYGAGIGLIVYVIRNWGGYPDGMAFAVLLMNIATPTLDYYTRPPVFGERDPDE